MLIAWLHKFEMREGRSLCIVLWTHRAGAELDWNEQTSDGQNGRWPSEAFRTDKLDILEADATAVCEHKESVVW